MARVPRVATRRGRSWVWRPPEPRGRIVDAVAAHVGSTPRRAREALSAGPRISAFIRASGSISRDFPVPVQKADLMANGLLQGVARECGLTTMGCLVK